MDNKKYLPAQIMVIPVEHDILTTSDSPKFSVFHTSVAADEDASDALVGSRRTFDDSYADF
ncbi:MAG: hypothetical protein MJZ89_00900 [Paludibacteraceae bacterium]|nr:hypothetical protein [Paludibacteraceae bacterium]